MGWDIDLSAEVQLARVKNTRRRLASVVNHDFPALVPVRILPLHMDTAGHKALWWLQVGYIILGAYHVADTQRIIPSTAHIRLTKCGRKAVIEHCQHHHHNYTMP